jgi:hypothetical protein
VESNVNSAGGIVALIRDIDLPKFSTSILSGIEVHIEELCLVKVKIGAILFPVILWFAGE